MEEIIITKEMREKINNYLGYELIKKGEIGHHIYDEAPGLGRIGIEGRELESVVTNKQLDCNGNIEWYKTPNPKTKHVRIKDFHCKLTTVSSKKAKILIASLFPEEAFDKNFPPEQIEQIHELRRELHVTIKKLEQEQQRVQKQLDYKPGKLVLGPNDMFLEGAVYYYYGREEEKKVNLYGPHAELLR